MADKNYNLMRWREEVELIERQIASLGDNLDILEAGCGRKWPLNLPVSYRLVGVDPDLKAVEARTDLDEFQAGTLNDAEFPENSFDVIYCSYVLEHVHGVHQVLENFARWIKPGGMIVLRIPDSRSAYAFLARVTPHWFHVMVYRYVFGRKWAGTPGRGPYPVVYERAMTLEGLQDYCERQGYDMSVTANMEYLASKPWLKSLVVTLFILSFGYLRWRHVNVAVLLRT